jgi:hypothetical protein
MLSGVKLVSAEEARAEAAREAERAPREKKEKERKHKHRHRRSPTREREPADDAAAAEAPPVDDAAPDAAREAAGLDWMSNPAHARPEAPRVDEKAVRAEAEEAAKAARRSVRLSLSSSKPSHS